MWFILLVVSLFMVISSSTYLYKTRQFIKYGITCHAFISTIREYKTHTMYVNALWYLVKVEIGNIELDVMDKFYTKPEIGEDIIITYVSDKKYKATTCKDIKINNTDIIDLAFGINLFVISLVLFYLGI